MEVLLTPYIVIFSLATVVSVSTIALKVKTFVEHFKEHHAHPEVLASRVGPIRIDAIEFPAEFAQLEAVQELKKSFRANHRGRLKLICALILGLLEGAPYLRSSLLARESRLWCAPHSHGWCAPALTCRLPNGDAVVVFSHQIGERLHLAQRHLLAKETELGPEVRPRMEAPPVFHDEGCHEHLHAWVQARSGPCLATGV
jgi:hypothetical protein